MTEEDFEKAEAAVKAVSDAYKKNNRLSLLNDAEKTLYEFAKKVLAEARRDFLTEENPHSLLEARVKNLEASAENTKAALERLCIVLAWKASPSISGTEASDVIEIARGEK
jgi:coenzyme F420-reducing hydrogenase alpha subunit